MIVASLIGTAPVYSGFTANFNNADYSNGADTGGVTGGTDFFFFGLSQDCTAPGNGFTDGCVVARSSDTTVTKATINGGPNGIVVDNYSTASQQPVSISWHRGQTPRTNSPKRPAITAVGRRWDPRCGDGTRREQRCIVLFRNSSEYRLFSFFTWLRLQPIATVLELLSKIQTLT